jgi:hypothetical protein
MRRHATAVVSVMAFSIYVNGVAGQASQSISATSSDKPTAKSEAVTLLLKTQLKAAQRCHRAALETMAVEQVGGLLVLSKGNQHARPDLAYTWSVRWLDAQRELSATPEARIAAYTDHQKRMKQLKETVTLLVGDGSGGLLDASAAPAADWYLAEAELWLLKEQGK